MFDSDLLEGTFLLKHWAGRNSRGVTQLDGRKIKEVLFKCKNEIKIEYGKQKLISMINS